MENKIETLLEKLEKIERERLCVGWSPLKPEDVPTEKFLSLALLSACRELVRTATQISKPGYGLDITDSDEDAAVYWAARATGMMQLSRETLARAAEILSGDCKDA